MKFRNGLPCSFSIEALLILSAIPAHAELLLVYEPVTNEVLGRLVQENNAAVFYDCYDKRHDPPGKEIRGTVEVCAGMGSIYASLEGKLDVENFIDMQVVTASSGDTLGTVTSLSVGDEGQSIGFIVGGFTEPEVQFSVPTGQVAEWEGGAGGALIANGNALSWVVDPAYQ